MIQEPSGRTNGIAFVGESPGREEKASGKPFIGYSGKILRQLCETAGIDLGESFITNICDEMAPRGKFQFFSKEKVIAGTAKVRERLERWKPNLIVALGKYPLIATTGNRVISQYRGSIQPAKIIPGMKVLPTYHPAFLLPNRGNSHLTPISQLDLHKAKRESSFSEIRYPPRNIEVIDNPMQAITFLDNLKPVPTTVDIETAGDVLTAFGVALAPDDCYSITHNCFKNKEVLRAIGRFSSSNVPKIYHNCLYDVFWLAYYMNVFTRNIYFDTMIAQHVCYSIWLKSLQFCSSIYTDEPYWKDRKDYLPAQDLYTYNGRDCGVTFEVYNKLKPELKETKLSLAFRHEMQMVDPVLVSMLLGVRTNKTAMKEIKTRNESIIKKYEYIADKIIPGVNVKSWQQLRDLFYDDWGFKSVKKHGKITTDAEAIVKMERLPTPYQSTLGLIRIMKKAYKSRSFYNFDTDEDGRIRTAYKITGTSTFRLSSTKGITGSGSNLQNQPKLMRRIYLADRGDIWIQWDLSQAEARIVAALCGDLEWLKAFDEDDVHWQVAEFIYHTNRSKLKKGIHRQAAKKVAHATHYLQGWLSLSNQLCITAADGKKFIRHYNELRPGLGEWHSEVETTIREKRELITPYGNRMIFPGSMSPDAMPLPTAVAFVPQNTCVQYAKAGWKEQARQMPWAKGMLQVHDSLNSSIPDDLPTIIKTMKIMKETTEVPLVVNNIKMIIPIDFEIGYDWYNLKECTIDNVEEIYGSLQIERRS